jgi:hypothetical protein
MRLALMSMITGTFATRRRTMRNDQKYFVLIALMLLFLFTAIKYHSHEVEKGKAISHFMKRVHGIDIPPEEAMYFDVVLTGVDVRFENVDIFPSLLKGRK